MWSAEVSRPPWDNNHSTACRFYNAWDNASVFSSKAQVQANQPWCEASKRQCLSQKGKGIELFEVTRQHEIQVLCLGDLGFILACFEILGAQLHVSAITHCSQWICFSKMCLSQRISFCMFGSLQPLRWLCVNLYSYIHVNSVPQCMFAFNEKRLTCIQRPAPPKIQPGSDLLHGLFWLGIHCGKPHARPWPVIEGPDVIRV